MVETVSVSKERYYQLLEDSAILCHLRNYGVDNWDGYEFAMQDYYNEEEEE